MTRTTGMIRHRLTSLLTVAVLGALAAGCSDSKQVEGVVTATDSVVDESTIPDDTTDESTTTSAADDTTTTTAVTTTVPATTVAPEVELVLESDGIGPHTLGDEAGAVVDGLIDQLGDPATDITTEYPSNTGLGEYQNTAGDTGFVAPVGRSVCWSFGFCAEFGGAAIGSMSFTGWTYRDDTAETLRSTSGATIGSSWADIAAMVVEPGGCYSVGSGTVDDIRLTLLSSGTPFSSFDANGNYIANLPAPGEVTISWMEIGEVPIFLYGDC